MNFKTILFFATLPFAAATAWTAHAQCGSIDFSGNPSTKGLNKAGLHLKIDPTRGQIIQAGGDEGDELYFQNNEWCVLGRHQKDGASDGTFEDDKKPKCGKELYDEASASKNPDGYPLGNKDKKANQQNSQGKSLTAALYFEPGGPHGSMVPVIKQTDDQGKVMKDAGYMRVARQTDDSFTNWDLQGYKTASGNCKKDMFAKLIFSQDHTGLNTSTGAAKHGDCNSVKFQGSPEVFASSDKMTSSSKGDDYTKTDVSGMCGNDGQSVATQNGETSASAGK